MNRFITLLLALGIICFNIQKSYAYYNTSDDISNSIHTNSYNIKLHTEDGYYDNSNLSITNNGITLPIPVRDGYSFINYRDSNNINYINPVSSLNIITNKDLYAVWEKNYYNVNYYLDGELLFTKLVGYNDNIENIDINYLLDKYHTFINWTNYQSNMPSSDINLYANTLESHCKLTTGHGPSGNALTLKKLFSNMGYNAYMRNADDQSNQYLVETDYSLTLREFEDMIEYLETNTNYKSYYPYPYLYWLGVNCDNGYSRVLQRNVGSIHFE